MTITLTGENSFGWQRELRRLTDDFVQEYGDLALERLDGEEADFEKIREALTGLPFLAGKKLVVLRTPGTNKQFVEAAEQLLEEVPETNEVVLIEPKLDKRTAYYKYLKKQTDFRESPALDQSGLVRWLIDEAKRRQAMLSATDARYLVERIGTNQQLLSNELEKLLLYSSTIDRRTIDLLTEPTPQSTIFELLEAAFAGRTQKTLELYAEQRALKVEPAQIIAMLTWQLHTLAVIKAGGDRSTDVIAKEAKINPFVIRKSQGITRQLTLGRLKQFIHDLLQIDVAIKTTSVDADEALQHYLLKLSA